MQKVDTVKTITYTELARRFALVRADLIDPAAKRYLDSTLHELATEILQLKWTVDELRQDLEVYESDTY